MGLHIGGGGASASGASTTDAITQNAHGFAAGDVVRWSGAVWVKAQADSAANAGNGKRAGVVDTPVTANSFYLRTRGRMTLTAHGYTVGDELFLSAATAGEKTTTAPAIVVPIATVIDANTIDVMLRAGYAT